MLNNARTFVASDFLEYKTYYFYVFFFNISCPDIAHIISSGLCLLQNAYRKLRVIKSIKYLEAI